MLTIDSFNSYLRSNSEIKNGSFRIESNGPIGDFIVEVVEVIMTISYLNKNYRNLNHYFYMDFNDYDFLIILMRKCI